MEEGRKGRKEVVGGNRRAMKLEKAGKGVGRNGKRGDYCGSEWGECGAQVWEVLWVVLSWESGICSRNMSCMKKSLARESPRTRKLFPGPKVLGEEG